SFGAGARTLHFQGNRYRRLRDDHQQQPLGKFQSHRPLNNHDQLMKTFLALALVFTFGGFMPVSAVTTIISVNKYAYGADVSWMDWRGDTANGAIIGEYVCSGYIYAANVGWINLGNGSPLNGIYYQNLSAADFGVNQDGFGNLRGFAYGANIGWINFTNATA